MNVTPRQLVKMIDHSFLKASGLPGDIERLCAEARAYGFAMVAINPAEVERCVHLLKGSGVGIGAAIGFPLGQSTSKVKDYETADAIGRGATEIDMVINIRALHAGLHGYVRSEIAAMVKRCRPQGIVCKVITENCYLNAQQKLAAWNMIAEEGADFVKTSTGTGPGGATIQDVAMMKKAVSGRCRIKAAGGIRDLQTALEMIEAGATRLGTSNGVAIMKELESASTG
jgi:deoxyribose-phosphate aldolase